jgi:hypothetical protein
LQKEYIKSPKEKGCGIPQGSAISAILSNVYVERAKEIFGDSEKAIDRSTKRHMQKIRKMLKTIKN